MQADKPHRALADEARPERLPRERARSAQLHTQSAVACEFWTVPDRLFVIPAGAKLSTLKAVEGHCDALPSCVFFIWDQKGGGGSVAGEAVRSQAICRWL